MLRIKDEQTTAHPKARPHIKIKAPLNGDVSTATDSAMHAKMLTTLRQMAQMSRHFMAGNVPVRILEF